MPQAIGNRMSVHVGGIAATGSAVMTPGFGLNAHHVVHAVGAVWQGGGAGEAAPPALASCYRQSLQRAADIAAVRVAFPAISAGVFGCPAPEAAWVAVATVRAFISSNRRPGGEISCCFDPASAELSRAALRSTGTNGSG